MKVEVLREHGNAHGDKYEKAVGDLYEIEDELEASALVDDGVVKEASRQKITAVEGKASGDPNGQG